MGNVSPHRKILYKRSPKKSPLGLFLKSLSPYEEVRLGAKFAQEISPHEIGEESPHRRKVRIGEIRIA